MKSRIETCIAKIADWMAGNRLKLNPSKTELIWCGTAHQCKSVDGSDFILDGISIAPVTTVKLLGVQMDGDLSMSSQVNSLVRSCFYQIRRMRSVRRCLTNDAAKTIAHSLILSRLDYCNGLLTGITKRQCDRLQSVLNTAAKVVCGGTRRDHVTPILRDNLHWLRFRERITYELCMIV